jgi:GMP synthase-like glutamine amidotransferase
MKPVHIVQHEAFQGPGYLDDFLTRHGVDYQIIGVPTEGETEELIAGTAGVILLGGRMDPKDSVAELEPERAFLRSAVELALPLLGHGLGAELIAEAMGARLTRNIVRRIGWFAVDPEAVDTIAPDGLELFAWHLRSFDLPLGARRLLRSRWCSTEAFATDRVFAVQGHPELTSAMLETWIEIYADDLANPREEPSPDSQLELNWDAIIQGPDSLRRNLEERLERMHVFADRLYERWLAAVHAESERAHTT